MTPEELMRLHDDELSEAELAALESALAEEDVEQLEGLEQLGNFIRQRAETQSGGFDIASEVLEQIGSGQAPRLRVVDGGASEPAAPAPRDAQAKGGAWGAVLAVAAVAAVAAGVVVTSTGDERGPGAMTASPVPAQPTPAAPAPAPEPTVEAPEEGPEVAIVSVDFGSEGGSIFVVGDESTPVIWLNDESPSEPQGRMGPL